MREVKDVLSDYMQQGFHTAWRDGFGKYHPIKLLEFKGVVPVAVFEDGTYTSLDSANREDFFLFNISSIFSS